jgi:2-polyprenyl-6-methoxyphenol hydroxylase-like FAD-dependent oxidoreductase
LYDLLRRQIPKERIHLGKKVLTTDQGGNGVLVRFSDGTEAEGDILVGADGAYSAVRQGLYAKLKKAKKLPASDALPLPFSTVCLVAQTRPLSVEEFPDLALEECQFRNTIGTDKMYAVSGAVYL